MQSNEGAPTISLQLVPKMLKPLVSSWVPQAFVVSFKLETDEALVIAKAREALKKYKHHIGMYNSNFKTKIKNQKHLGTYIFLIEHVNQF